MVVSGQRDSGWLCIQDYPRFCSIQFSVLHILSNKEPTNYFWKVRYVLKFKIDQWYSETEFHKLSLVVTVKEIIRPLYPKGHKLPEGTGYSQSLSEQSSVSYLIERTEPPEGATLNFLPAWGLSSLLVMWEEVSYPKPVRKLCSGSHPHSPSNGLPAMGRPLLLILLRLKAPSLYWLLPVSI